MHETFAVFHLVGNVPDLMLLETTLNRPSLEAFSFNIRSLAVISSMPADLPGFTVDEKALEKASKFSSILLRVGVTL